MAGVIGVPVLENSETLPLLLFASHTFPAPSMAIPLGKAMPPPVYPADGETAVPELENSARVPEHAAHALPDASIATACGPGNASPPPEYPPDGDTAVPALENLLRLAKFSSSANHALPEPSMATEIAL